MFLRSPGAVVTFLVGPVGEKEEFVIHKEHCCFYSTVLKAAFTGNFVEGQTQTYRLDENTSSAFRLFTQWLYTQELKVKQLQISREEHKKMVEGPKNPFGAENMDLAELWVLADKMAMPDLQNKVICTIIEIRKHSWHTLAWSTLEFIYENTAVDSLLRQVMVKEVALHGIHADFQKIGTYPKEFIADLAKYMLSFRINTALQGSSHTWSPDLFVFEQSPRENTSRAAEQVAEPRAGHAPGPVSRGGPRPVVLDIDSDNSDEDVEFLSAPVRQNQRPRRPI